MQSEDFWGFIIVRPFCYANVPAAIDVNIFLAWHVFALVFEPPIDHPVFLKLQFYERTSLS